MPFRLEADSVDFCLAAAGQVVWLASGSKLQKLDARSGQELGSRRLQWDVTDLSALSDMVFAAGSDGIVAGLDPATLKPRFQTYAATSAVRLAAGDDCLWTAEPERAVVRRYSLQGMAEATVETVPIDRFVAGCGGAWFTSPEDTLLHFSDGKRSSYRSADFGLASEQRGALQCCANAVWLSVPRALAWAPAYTMNPGRPFPAPCGPVEHLVCCGGRLVGGDRLEEMFMLDPAADADVRRLETGSSGEVAALLAAGPLVWCVERRGLQVHLFEF